MKYRKSRALDEQSQGAPCGQVGTPCPPSPFCNVRDRNVEVSHSRWPSVEQVGYALSRCQLLPGWWFQAPHMHEPHDILCIAWLPNLDLLWVAEQERLLIISTSLAWLKWNDFTFTLCSVHTPAWNQKPECWEKAWYKKSSAAAKCLKRRAAPTAYFLNVSCEWN